jgi:hypothetical protein
MLSHTTAPERRGRQYQEQGENCLMRTLIICSLYPITGTESRRGISSSQGCEMAVFWDAEQCDGLVEIYRRFKCGYSLHHRHNDEGSKQFPQD